ncbi:CDP-alcohol phosphatidyltransferase family protein [Catenulispora yoronensis]|uniref:Phosphatidylinositol phosphate synthase n=1 Tax=Catenulispora yoronensis TaxID=450799 RepID=A0ABP5GP37_9ACTN
MLNRYARAFFTAIFTPTARFFLKVGISPDAVTLVGTLGVIAGALCFFPRGSFFVGTLVITAFVFSDLIDGTMARMSKRKDKFGAFWDSTLDRLGDAAIFGGLAYWFARGGDQPVLFVVCLACMGLGAVVSYARARAEGLGVDANVGYVERSERLVGSLVATGLDGLGVPYVQAITLWAIAIGSFITLVQRVMLVRRELLKGEAVA